MLSYDNVRAFVDDYGGSGSALVKRAESLGITPAMLVGSISAVIAQIDRRGPEFEPDLVLPGTIDVRVLDQERWWVDILGVPRLLTDLTDSHLAVVMDYLVNNRQRLREAHSRSRADAPEAMPDEAWLERTHLMRALRTEYRARWERLSDEYEQVWRDDG